MLQIKKKGFLVKVKYNLNFLFRNKKFAEKYKAKKGVAKLIILRAPKHFNIGKHKLLSLNYKTMSLVQDVKIKFFVGALQKKTSRLYNIFLKTFILTPTISIYSMRLVIKTKFKIKWLVIL